MDGDNEEWRPVVGYEGIYDISNLGRVKSLDRVIPHRHSGYLTIRARIIAQQVSEKDGYVRCQLYTKGKGKYKTVHRMLAEAFIPNLENHPLVLHRDDNPSNNDLSNLRWGTFSDNGIDARNNGLNQNSNKTHCPREHPLERPNLVEGVLPYRSCRACTYERVQARTQKRPFDKARADGHYRRILEKYPLDS